jgi:hypothetical protein
MVCSAQEKVPFDFWCDLLPDIRIWRPSRIWFLDDNFRKTSQIDLIFLEYNGDAQEKVPFDF